MFYFYFVTNNAQIYKKFILIKHFLKKPSVLYNYLWNVITKFMPKFQSVTIPMAIIFER